MQKTAYTSFAIIQLLVFFLYSCRGPEPSPGTDCQRIASLSPAITDIIIDLARGDLLAGATQYCDIPEEYEVKRVGTLLDINFEQLYLLKPDMVFLTPYHSVLFPKLRELSIEYKSIRLETIDDIFSAIRIIGESLDEEEKAENLVKAIRGELDNYIELASCLPKYSILLVIGRDDGKINSFYSVGRNNFLNEVLGMLNSTNPLSEQIPSYPLISGEELYSINPDFIIELYADRELDNDEAGQRINDWYQFSDVNAVKNSRVYLINRPYIVRPSSKITFIIRDIYDIIKNQKRRFL